MRRALLALGIAAALAGPARASPSMTEARRLVAELNAELLSHASATETLQHWCATRHLAEPARIVAHRLLGADKAATPQVRRLLHAAPGEPIRYRRVALACGDRVLSNADNWYRPGALTKAMKAELDATDHPFGLVVKPLGFHRRTLTAKVLVMARSWRLPAALIRHRAVLEAADGTPFSLVVETYTDEVLGEGASSVR
ncbi:MAG TPA: hypothetical protein VFE13_13250 [Caulobacteraceae bacterium]|nr:hypothetical protein [Caulobacteraceae bacterium]